MIVYSLDLVIICPCIYFSNLPSNSSERNFFKTDITGSFRLLDHGEN